MGKGSSTSTAPGVLPATPEETKTLNYILDWSNALGSNMGNFMRSSEYQMANAVNNWSALRGQQLAEQLAGSAGTGRLNDSWQKNIEDTVGRTAQNTMGKNLSNAASRGVVNSTYMTQMNNDLAKSTSDAITDKYADLYKLQQESLGQGISTVNDAATSAWRSALAPLTAQTQYMAPLLQLWQTMYQSRMTPGTQNTIVKQGSSPFGFLSAITPFFGG